MTKLKVILGHAKPEDAPKGHIYVSSLDAWEMMKILGVVREMGLPMNGLGDGDLHVGADDVNLGISPGRKHEFWAAYYEYLSRDGVNDFATGESVDITKKVMKAIGFMKKLLENPSGYPAGMIKAEEHLVLSEDGVSLFAGDFEINRPLLPRGLKAAVFIHTKAGYVDVHTFRAPNGAFNAYSLTQAALREKSTGIRGNKRRARIDDRLTMRELMILFSHVVTCSQYRD